MNRFYCYLLIDSKSNTPFWVGKGTGDRLKRCIWQTRRGKIPHNNKHLYYTIKNLLDEGTKIIATKIAENLSEEDALNLETETIEKYGIDNLCNICFGGKGTACFKQHYTDEWRRKISEAKKGKASYRPGYKHSEETKQKMSEHNARAMKGKVPWNKGKSLGTKTRQKMSEASKKLIRNEEYKKALSQRMTEWWRQRKANKA